jgi:hypothetical protein
MNEISKILGVTVESNNAHIPQQAAHCVCHVLYLFAMSLLTQERERLPERG